MTAKAVLLFIIILPGVLIANPETRERYAQRTTPFYIRFEAIQKGVSSSPEEIVQLVRQIDDAWQSLPPEDKQFLAKRRWHDYPMASAELAHLERYSDAGEFLRKQVTFCKEFGMSATGSSEHHFSEFALLQARIASGIGRDPLAGMTDHLFRQQGDKFIVARLEFEAEVKGITIDLEEFEALALVLQVIIEEGRAMIETTRWIVGPKGNVEETLRRATREMAFDVKGRLSSRPLSGPVFAPDTKPAEAALIFSATPAPMAAKPTAAQEDSKPAPHPIPTIESQDPVGLWVLGIFALTAIVFLLWNRRT